MNVCDFDDLLTKWADLLDGAAADELARQFDHVLVDEYQDINSLQGQICDAMARANGSLTCVGDDAQSIYAFRGADYRQIRSFEQRHEHAKTLELTINYRSTPQILALANRSISNNTNQHAKRLRSVKSESVLPAVIPLRDVYQQAEFVAQRMLELHHEHGWPLRHMAVLYRNHSHSLELQVELTRRQIPFTVRSGLRFFEQAHVKDVTAYLRVFDNPLDALAWMRLLRLWPGIGKQTAETLTSKIVEHAREGSQLEDAFLQHKDAAPGRARPTMTRLAELWHQLANATNVTGDLIRAVVKHHYSEHIDRAFTNPEARREDLDHLATYADRYETSRLFLSELALIQGVGAESVMAAEPSDDHVILSTIHQAKGLEWPACFTIWLAEGRFPMPQALRTPEALEEERRLFYVAATRAADELYLCYPTVEERRDGPAVLLRASRFLSEIDTAPPVFDRWQIVEEPATDA